MLLVWDPTATIEGWFDDDAGDARSWFDPALVAALARASLTATTADVTFASTVAARASASLATTLDVVAFAVTTAARASCTMSATLDDVGLASAVQARATAALAATLEDVVLVGQAFRLAQVRGPRVAVAVQRPAAPSRVQVTAPQRSSIVSAAPGRAAALRVTSPRRVRLRVSR